ncbi:MAG TPA: malate synthase A [Longimicrobiales bacterium]|nr:malate synthase A [Longimicrobiales bacterium]
MPEMTLDRLEVRGSEQPEGARVLTSEALAFVSRLHEEFDGRRRDLLARRDARLAEIRGGSRPDFHESTRSVREGSWRVAEAPEDLRKRVVEITGPVDRKMMINALNSEADVFMADFEDALSPTWANVVAGQANCMDAVRREIRFENPDGKRYELNEETATLVVRPRGWHLDEKHVVVDGAPVSGSLFDFGLYFFHNARALLERGSGPYFYLPKLESHLEARLWNDVFLFAQEALGVPRGSIRATVLIETILAAFEMDEILYELREHMAGLNAGRWDYIFSAIKTFRDREDTVLPDRGLVTMEVPFMRAYAELLVRTCHRRGAHAMGGMAAFIPSRDPEANERAFEKVREDKVRESRAGFDGTWIAHPALAPVARDAFDAVLDGQPHQKDRLREDVDVEAEDLLAIGETPGKVTHDGVRLNVGVALEYIAAWLGGQGAVAINNLMEDAATAEISRSQLWQWHHSGTPLADGGTLSAELYTGIRDEEVERLRAAGVDRERLDAAAGLLDALVLDTDFIAFLTTPGYEELD